VGYKGAVLLAGLISAPRNNTGYANELQVLNASRTELQDLGVRRIAAAMCENSSVVELDVSFCIPLQYDNSSACTAGSSLGKMIAVNTTLHTLRLRGNHFPPQECVSLLRGLHSAAATSALRKLDLSYVPLQGNNVAPAVTLALKQIVSVHSRLAELSLNHCQLTGECLSALASGLTHNSSLHTLHAAGNECTHQAMEHFGDLLAGDTALRVLDLSASADERAHRMRSEV
jgi:Ran GTPase-activating protein (RanGAP) involved in mRNA processing and transport